MIQRLIQHIDRLMAACQWSQQRVGRMPIRRKPAEYEAPAAVRPAPPALQNHSAGAERRQRPPRQLGSQAGAGRQPPPPRPGSRAHSSPPQPGRGSAVHETAHSVPPERCARPSTLAAPHSYGCIQLLQRSCIRPMGRPGCSGWYSASGANTCSRSNINNLFPGSKRLSRSVSLPVRKTSVFPISTVAGVYRRQIAYAIEFLSLRLACLTKRGI